MMVHYPHILSRFGALLALLSCSFDLALAQTALDTAAAYQAGSLMLGEAAVVSDATTARIVNGAARASAEPLPLRHLAASPRGWRVVGETGTLVWRIYLTDQDAAEMRRFRLAYSSAASVLPDASTLELQVNDERIDRRAIATPDERRPTEFDIPSGTLRRGFNTVTLAVDQHHRVDCTTEAAYELWTEVDPAKTGLLGAAARPALRLSDLAALRPRSDGALVVRVLFQGRMRSQRIDQTIRAAQAISLAGRFEHVVVSFSPDPEVDTGVNLVVGTSEEVSGTLGSAADTTTLSGATLSLKYLPGLRAPALVVSAASDQAISSAIEQISAAATFDQSTRSTGNATRIDPPPIAGGERIRLGDIGLPDADFTGRLFRFPFAIEMPADFLAADYDKVFFALSGKYAGDLTEAARLTIHINGRDAGSVPLPKPSSTAFLRNDIAVPLSFLKPGRNLIEITAELPDRNHGVCTTEPSSTGAGNRFRLLGDSEIRVPHLARVAQMPALMQTAAGGYPYSSPGIKPKLYVPSPDRDALSAAATLAVRLSVAAGRQIPFEIVLSNPPIGAGPGLLVAPAQALDPALMKAVQLDPDAVQRGWEHRSPSSETQVVAWSPSRPREATVSLSNWISDRIAAALARIFHVGEPPFQIGEGTSLIVAQGYRTQEESDVVTIVTAPDSAALARSVAALVGPTQWFALRGRLVAMDVSAKVLQTIEPSRVNLIQTQPVSLRNSRLVVAGWLSLHPSAYAGSALLIAALLAAATAGLVKNLGRRNS